MQRTFGVAAGHHGGPSVQLDHQAGLGHAERLLLHGLVDCRAVRLPDGRELVDAAHPACGGVVLRWRG